MKTLEELEDEAYRAGLSGECVEDDTGVQWCPYGGTLAFDLCRRVKRVPDDWVIPVSLAWQRGIQESKVMAN